MKKRVVGSLILINVVVYIVQRQLPEFMAGHFALWPLGDGFQPWQLITSAFLHDPEGISHILLNMYGLWMFGRIVEEAVGSRRFLWLYLASVLTSALVQLVVVSAGDVGSYTVGASGGVFGVLLAFGMLFPHSRVMLIFPPIPMKAWFMVVAYGTIELVSGVTGTFQGVAHFAHLGGMLGALILMLTWRRRLPPAPRDASKESESGVKAS